MIRLPMACLSYSKLFHPVNMEIFVKQTHKRFFSVNNHNLHRINSLINKKSFLKSNCCLGNQFFGLKTENSNENQKINKNFETNNTILTIPNCLTMLRIISIPFINYFIILGRHDLACGLFVASSLTDFLDGFIARNVPNQKSYIGSIIDPLADKLLIGSLVITLTIYNMIPLVLSVIILSRDLALIIASLVIRFKSLEHPITINKFLNVRKYSNVQVEADFISKLNTAFQLSLISLTLPSVLFGYVDSFILTGLQYITGTTTILSSISYLYKRGSYKIIDVKKDSRDKK